MTHSSLDRFTPAAREWFADAFDEPTPAQTQAWPAIATGEHVLISAPTGSGKTLAAFLWGLDRLVAEPPPSDPKRRRTRLVYVSPLKALGYDIEKNLRAPLRGIGADVRVAIRTGDTPQAERRDMLRHPPDVLITTPESLYLMLTSRARKLFEGTEWVIVDEIHSVAQTKRGAHLALSLERLVEAAGRDVQRIGLSATQRPLEEVGRFLVGPERECTLVDTGVRKPLDLRIHVPVESMTDPEHADLRLDQSVGKEATRRSIWPAMYPELLELVRRHRSTLIFVNNRRAAERLALRLNELAERESAADGSGGRGPADAAGDDAAADTDDWSRRAGSDRTRPPLGPVARAHHGSLAREERLLVEDQLKAGELPCLVATSSLELGIDMGAVDLVVQIESPKSVTSGLQRIGRAGHGVGDVSRGRIFPKFRADLLECAVVAKRMREGLIETTVVPRNPLDVLAQQIVAMAAAAQQRAAEAAGRRRGKRSAADRSAAEDRARDEDAEGSARAGEDGAGALKVDDLFALVRRTHTYAELERRQFEHVLDMLDGRYPSDEFGELRPRIVWDRIAGTVRARRGARALAVANAGTIPDRGLFTVNLPDGRRVGELDEEMVYEARLGQTFLLGASAWRIEEITRDRVVVSPAPGASAAVPFWHGEGVGRPSELGESIGAFSRWAVEQDETTLERDYDLDERAARNLLDYLREQQEVTRVLPSDTTIVVERFRDEIGDWRLCVLSPYGGRVHAAWGLAIGARVRAALGLEADAIWSDDGIIVHLPDADEPPSADLVMIEPDEVEDLVVGELGTSALFGARFRENAGRSLLIPRARPGKRRPLWQQRLKSQSLLEVARDYGDFPIVLETYRECLQDVLDMPGLTRLLTRLSTGELSVVEVETATASPFASSLLFDYIATYMYERDTPNAERRAAALALDRDLLRELLGQEELRELIDADALAAVEDELQRRSARTRAGSADELHDVLRHLGDLTSDEVDERAAGAAEDGAADVAGLGEEATGAGATAAEWLAGLERQRRAVRVVIAGEERWIAAEDAGLFRDALGLTPPDGLPQAFLTDVPDGLTRLVRRWARSHGPFLTADLRARYGVDLTPILTMLEGQGELVRGELRPGGTEREWCDPDVLRRLRRSSLAALRREIEPADQLALARFAASWHGVERVPTAGHGHGGDAGPSGVGSCVGGSGVGRDAAPGGHGRRGGAAHLDLFVGVDRLREVLVPLQGMALTPEVWERDVLPARLAGYSPAWLDRLCATGEVVWVGAGALGRGGRVALYFRDDAPLLGPPPGTSPGAVGGGAAGGGGAPEGCQRDSPHEAVRRRLRTGACFYADLMVDLGDLAGDELQTALWELVWAGEVTNDAFAPLRAPRSAVPRGPSRPPTRGRSGRRFGRQRRGSAPQTQGRWSLSEALFAAPAGEVDLQARRRGWAELLLERHGIVTRELVRAEGIPGGFAALYDELSALETLGAARRGYFVEGLGGAQFALPGAVERLRAQRECEDGSVLVLAATDPAQPYGAALRWPGRSGGSPGASASATSGASRRRAPSRQAGAFVVTVAGVPVAYVERGGRSLETLGAAASGSGHAYPAGPPQSGAGDAALDLALRALATAVWDGRVGRLALERIDGEDAIGSPLAERLIGLGFRAGPRRLVLRPERR